MTHAFRPPWQPMDEAPRDGTGFLAYGIHDTVGRRVGRRPSWHPGDHWWSILLFDIWRLEKDFVFAKDGTQPWSQPLCWQPLWIPEPAGALGRFGVHAATADYDDDGLVRLTAWQSSDAGPMRMFTPSADLLLDVPHATELLGTLAIALEKSRATQFNPKE